MVVHVAVVYNETYMSNYMCTLINFRIYSYCFPMMITVLRYLFVVHSMKVKSFGMVRVVSTVIVISVLLPFLMTISVQYPVSDFIHGPLNLCIGRFEVYFNPHHPDTITEGKKHVTVFRVNEFVLLTAKKICIIIIIFNLKLGCHLHKYARK